VIWPFVFSILIAASIFCLVIVRTAWTVTHPNRRWRPRGWEPSPLNPDTVTFPSADGTQLHGGIKLHPEPRGTVLCVHGLGANQSALEWRAYRLYTRGFSVFLFDLRACGKSSGRVTTGGVRETEDVAAALDLCLKHRYLSRAPIVALADSMGGTATLNVAASRPEIKAVFSDAAFASMTTVIRWGFTRHTGLPAWPFQRPVVRLAEKLSGERISDASAIETIGDIAPRHIYLAHGLCDSVVPPSDAQLLFDRARQPKHLWLVPDAGHVVGAYVDPEDYADRVTSFFLEATAATNHVPP
jgi:fermentation-respiration switch protein FrsA (DUF1100 family)